MSRKGKGGYKLISLGLVALSVEMETATIDGIYESIENSWQKPLLLTGINVGGVEKNDVYVIPKLSGTSYVLENVYGLDITINEDDEITCEEHEKIKEFSFKTSSVAKDDVVAIVKHGSNGHLLKNEDDGAVVFRIVYADVDAHESEETLLVVSSAQYADDGTIETFIQYVYAWDVFVSSIEVAKTTL